MLQYVRHIFGAKVSRTCAIFALKRNATDNKTTFPEAALSGKRCFYIDDYLESRPTVEETTRKTQDLVKILAKVRFTLTKFVSSVRGMLATLNGMENLVDGNVKALRAED